MVHNIFKGLGIALITPFQDDGSVDYEALIRLVDWQLKNGADFFCPDSRRNPRPSWHSDW